MAKSSDGDEGSEKDLAGLLKTALRRKREKPMRYAIVAKGSNDGAILLSKKKISPDEIAQAKKSTGGKLISRGICFGEEGRLVFEAAKTPPATMAKTIKTLAKKYAKLAVKPMCRAAGAGELDADEAESGGADFDRKRAALMTAFETARNRNPEMAGQLEAKLNEAQGLADAKNFDGGLEALKVLKALIAHALGGPPPAPKGVTEEAYKKQVAKLTPNLTKILSEKVGDFKVIKKLFQDAQALADSRHFAEAVGALDVLQEAMTFALRTTGSAGPSTMLGKKVQLGVSRIEWSTGKSTARGELSKLQNIMSQINPERGDLIKELDGTIEDFDIGLTEALDAAYQAADEAVQRKHHQEALSAVAACKSTVESSELLAHLDAFPSSQIKVQATLVACLNQLHSSLSRLISSN